MGRKRELSKECQEVIAKEEERESLVSLIEAQAQELMSCGFTYKEAMSWINKQRISNIFEKDERAERWD